MEEIVIYKYKANDGTMFDDEDECLRYEMEQTIKNTGMVIKDAYGEAFNLIDDGVDDALNNAAYVILKTDDDVEAYNSLCEYYGYQNIKEPGNWYYDNDEDKWMKFNDLVDKVNEMAVFFDQTLISFKMRQ